MDKFMYYDSEKITGLNADEIFVFGSNEAGIHGAGAAKMAMVNFKADYGVGFGFTGQCYAIPTKDEHIVTRSLRLINTDVARFLVTAECFEDYDFIVTKIGCGLAGYTDEQIAPMFKLAPKNCIFHKDWKQYLE